MANGFQADGYTVARIGRGLPLDVDLTSETDVVRAFEAVHQLYGSIYALVHTVGMWAMKSLSATTMQDWRTMMEVNLTSTFLCFREAARFMGEGGGRLVGITAAQGADRGQPEQAAYAASKAGVIRLVEATAQEYASRGITTHALAPGMIVYDGHTAEGVRASDLVSAALFLCGPAGSAASGATWRMYGPKASS